MSDQNPETPAVIFPGRPIFGPEWGEQLTARLDEYMAALEQGLQDDAEVEPPETLSGEPYCGCGDCWEREYLLMATALVIEGYREGMVEVEES